MARRRMGWGRGKREAGENKHLRLRPPARHSTRLRVSQSAPKANQPQACPPPSIGNRDGILIINGLSVRSGSGNTQSSSHPSFLLQSVQHTLSSPFFSTNHSHCVEPMTLLRPEPKSHSLRVPLHSDPIGSAHPTPAWLGSFSS